jgi:hypothetical protein
VYDHVTKMVKKAFPEKFETKEAPVKRAAEVDSSNRNSGGSSRTKGLKVSDLNDDEKRVMNVFVKQRRIMTQDQYLDQLAAAKGIK